eukprot:gene893-1117_t
MYRVGLALKQSAKIKLTSRVVSSSTTTTRSFSTKKKNDDEEAEGTTTSASDLTVSEDHNNEVDADLLGEEEEVDYDSMELTRDDFMDLIDENEDEMMIDTRKVEIVKEVVQEKLVDIDKQIAHTNLKELKLQRYIMNPDLHELMKREHVNINDAFELDDDENIKFIREEAHKKAIAELPGSKFNSVKIPYKSYSQIKTNYLSSQLHKFKQQFEKPLVELYKETTNQVNVEFKSERAQKRRELKKIEKEKKPQKLSALESHYRDLVHVRNALDREGKTFLMEDDEADAWNRLISRTEITDPHNLNRYNMTDEYNDLGYDSETAEEYINQLSMIPFDFANPRTYSSVSKLIDEFVKIDENNNSVTGNVNVKMTDSDLVVPKPKQKTLEQQKEFYTKQIEKIKKLEAKVQRIFSGENKGVANAKSTKEMLDSGSYSISRGTPLIPSNFAELEPEPFEEDVPDIDLEENTPEEEFDPTEEVEEVSPEVQAMLDQYEDLVQKLKDLESKKISGETVAEEEINAVSKEIDTVARKVQELEYANQKAIEEEEDSLAQKLAENYKMEYQLPELETVSQLIRAREEITLDRVARQFADKEVNEKSAHEVLDLLFESYKTDNLFSKEVQEFDARAIRQANGDVAIPESMYFEYDTTFRDLVDRDVLFKMPLKDTDLIRVLTHQLVEIGLLKQHRYLDNVTTNVPLTKEFVEARPHLYPDYVEEVDSQTVEEQKLQEIKTKEEYDRVLGENNQEKPEITQKASMSEAVKKELNSELFNDEKVEETTTTIEESPSSSAIGGEIVETESVTINAIPHSVYLQELKNILGTAKEQLRNEYANLRSILELKKSEDNKSINNKQVMEMAVQQMESIEKNIPVLEEKLEQAQKSIIDILENQIFKGDATVLPLIHTRSLLLNFLESVKVLHQSPDEPQSSIVKFYKAQLPAFLESKLDTVQIQSFIDQLNKKRSKSSTETATLLTNIHQYLTSEYERIGVITRPIAIEYQNRLAETKLDHHQATILKREKQLSLELQKRISSSVKRINETQTLIIETQKKINSDPMAQQQQQQQQQQSTTDSTTTTTKTTTTTENTTTTNNSHEDAIYDQRRVVSSLKPANPDNGIITLPHLPKLRPSRKSKLDRHDPWLMGKPFDMGKFRLAGQENDLPIRKDDGEDEDENENEVAQIGSDPAIEDEDHDDWADDFEDDQEDPEDYEDTELYSYLNEGHNEEWFRPDKIGDKDILQLERGQRWFPREHIDTYPVEFISSHSTTDQTERDQWVNRKCVMKVNISSFDLPEVVLSRLLQLVGKRYEGGTLTLVANHHKHFNDNKHHVKKLFRELLHEAYLADPNFISTKPDLYEIPQEPVTFVPSQLSSTQDHYNIFRLRGFPIYAALQSQKASFNKLLDSKIQSSTI